VEPKSGACAHFLPDESRSPARPRRALPVRRQSLSVARSHLLCRPTFSLIPSGVAVGTLLLARLAGAMASGKGWVRVASVAEARCEGALETSGNVKSLISPAGLRCLFIHPIY
jgi:hypothetical protein